jgi:transcription elongation factor GreB
MSAPTEDDEFEAENPQVPGSKNYMTRTGYLRLRQELGHLLETERPHMVNVVSWAASNGDRSENGDYIYGKRRLREIDRRIRFLTKRLELAEVVDAHLLQQDRVLFGAEVVYLRSNGQEETVRIVGVDEIDPAKQHISWISPVARALLKSQEGDEVCLHTPAGVETLEILKISYPQD